MNAARHNQVDTVIKILDTGVPVDDIDSVSFNFNFNSSGRLLLVMCEAVWERSRQPQVLLTWNFAQLFMTLYDNVMENMTSLDYLILKIHAQT